jgi:hypothetical protein
LAAAAAEMNVDPLAPDMDEAESEEDDDEADYDSEDDHE